MTRVAPCRCTTYRPMAREVAVAVVGSGSTGPSGVTVIAALRRPSLHVLRERPHEARPVRTMCRRAYVPVRGGMLVTLEAVSAAVTERVQHRQATANVKDAPERMTHDATKWRDPPWNATCETPPYIDRKSTRLNCSHLGSSYAVY